MFSSKATDKGLSFGIHPAAGLPSRLRTDPVRLRQCLVNLVSNAIKFTSQGHVFLNVSCDGMDGQSCLRFDVEDTGIGIPPDRQEAIFEAFTQADGSTTRQYGGTGLGLTITRRLATLMNGRLSMTSHLDRGSVFTLLIPVGVDESRDRPSLDPPADGLQDRRNMEDIQLRGHVLVAEDAPANQMLIRALLKRLGLEVTIVDNGRQALTEGKRGTYDVILMDMQMPQMNGYDATRVLREQGCTLPIIAITAHAMKGDEDECLAAGCDGYLAKPIQADRLAQLLCKYLSPAADPASRAS
jgi:CheY-like chemotaxis protein